VSCRSGKVAYASPQAAHAVLELQRRRGKNARRNNALSWAKGRETAYRCPICSAWHIGHQVIRQPSNAHEARA